MGADLLEVEGLHAGYGPVEVLHGIDLSVGEGEIVVVLGANGAGKTTTMRAVSGMIPRRGLVRFAGNDISDTSTDAIVRAGVAHVPQGRGTFSDLTVEDNLRVGAYVRNDEPSEDIERWLNVFSRLKDRRTQKAGSLSGGEQQMLAIARALMCRPQLLLCDEPSLGLAPILVQDMFRTLAEMNRDNGTAILLVEQNANLALEIAHRVYLLETGSIVATGDAESMLHDDAVRKAYLGY
ncbi:MAG TPA: ABC transporter ATP-binding protein [Acidimicrobiales bacterium]|nr:ABC transporter ATP-binding protein [Acidimicrobiales bacterium]